MEKNDIYQVKKGTDTERFQPTHPVGTSKKSTERQISKSRISKRYSYGVPALNRESTEGES